jgi:phosphoribosyl 1,2-cyclic phosphodiesterase
MSFSAHEKIFIGDLTVTPFPKFHDASDPYSFIVACKEVKVGVFTDIGIACREVINYFQQCHAVFLEANYDDIMLERGNYPYFLKSRIRGGKGHLSNKQALELFTRYKPPFMSHLFLSHLSQNNNCPILVGELFKKYAGGVKMIITSRFEETPIFHINNVVIEPFNISHNAVPAHQLSFSFV